MTTAVCLGGLAAFVVHDDADVRRRTDAALVAQAKLFSTGVTVDARFGFSFAGGSPKSSGSGLAAIGSVPVGFIDSRGIAYASPSQDALPSSVVIDQLFADVAMQDGPAFTTASDLQGHDYRWVARPVSGSETAIVVVGSRSVVPFSHADLASGLAAAVALLVVVAAAAGHALSARAMRPALRQVERQEQFLREAAHELRTPLSTLGLLVESGLRDPAVAKESLEAIEARLSTINTVVASLLARARLETGASEIELRPLRLDQLVEVTVVDMNLFSRVIVDAEPSIVEGNAELIAQAVRNLVDNAVRYGGDGVVTVSVNENSVSVTDRGADSSLSEKPAPRSQVGSAGTGTGLSIVSWVAELHAAHLTIEPRTEGGTRSTLRFPSSRVGRSGLSHPA